MKQPLKTICVAIVFAFAAMGAYAQTFSPIFPSWVSDRGYWVLERNRHDRFNPIVRFYNNENRLVYTAHFTRARLNTDSKKVKMKLKRAVDEVINLSSQQADANLIQQNLERILR